MTEWLLDTNVVSESVRPRPDSGVIEFLSNLEVAYISVVTLHELEFGRQRAPSGRRRTELGAWLAALRDEYAERILAIGQDVAITAARLRAAAADDGATVHLADALIAGAAVHHGLTIATRNTRDFDALSVSTFNPWTA